MSFLNSVLGSIGGDARTPLPPPQLPPPKPGTTNGFSSNKTAAPHGSQRTIQSFHKRNAEEELPRSDGNNQNADPTKQRKLHSAQATIAQASASLALKPISIPVPTSVPYRGTSRPSPISAEHPTPGSGSGSLKPPKKGSYAEIMARAKASKDGGKPVGIIKHKPKDKLSSRKELLMLKQALSGTGNARAKNRSNSSMSESKPNGGGPTSSTLAKPQSGHQVMMKQRPQPSYKGTMTSVVPSSSGRPGTMRERQTSSQSSNLTVNQPLSKRPASSKYHCGGDDDDDDGDEDGLGDEDVDDYESDDMEAGAEDLFEEEERSARIAKREDALEMKREMEQKNQKEARKRALQELANKAKRR